MHQSYCENICQHSSQQNHNLLRFYCKSENKVVYQYPYQGNPKLEYSMVAKITSVEVQKLYIYIYMFFGVKYVATEAKSIDV